MEYEVSVQVPPDSELVIHFLLLSNSFQFYFGISKSEQSPEYLGVGTHLKDCLGSLAHFF